MGHGIGLLNLAAQVEEGGRDPACMLWRTLKILWIPLTRAVVVVLSRLCLLWRLCSSPRGCFILFLEGRSVVAVQLPARGGTKLPLAHAKPVQTVIY